MDINKFVIDCDNGLTRVYANGEEIDRVSNIEFSHVGGEDASVTLTLNVTRKHLNNKNESSINAKLDELQQAAQPLVCYLLKNYNSKTTVVVSTDRVDVMSKEMGFVLGAKVRV